MTTSHASRPRAKRIARPVNKSATSHFRFLIFLASPKSQAETPILLSRYHRTNRVNRDNPGSVARGPFDSRSLTEVASSYAEFLTPTPPFQGLRMPLRQENLCLSSAPAGLCPLVHRPVKMSAGSSVARETIVCIRYRYATKDGVLGLNFADVAELENCLRLLSADILFSRI